MTTQEVADKLMEYCAKGDWEKAVSELYSPDIVSKEMPGTPFTEVVEGFDGIAEKGKKWNEMVETFHGVKVEGPLVAGDHFCIHMAMDITMKGRERAQDPELCMYRVKDGKIVSEQFFYATE